MAARKLGVLEQEIVAATLAAGADAYGLAIARLLEVQTGRKPSIGAVYTVLDRLETKGFLSSKWGEHTPERGGRRKRIYTVNATGQAAAAGANIGRSLTTIAPPWAGSRPQEG